MLLSSPQNFVQHHLVQQSTVTAPKHSCWMTDHCIKSACNHSKVTALTKCYETFILNRNYLIDRPFMLYIRSTCRITGRNRVRQPADHTGLCALHLSELCHSNDYKPNVNPQKLMLTLVKQHVVTTGSDKRFSQYCG